MARESPLLKSSAIAVLQFSQRMHISFRHAIRTSFVSFLHCFLGSSLSSFSLKSLLLTSFFSRNSLFVFLVNASLFPPGTTSALVLHRCLEALLSSASSRNEPPFHVSSSPLTRTLSAPILHFARHLSSVFLGWFQSPSRKIGSPLFANSAIFFPISSIVLLVSSVAPPPPGSISMFSLPPAGCCVCPTGPLRIHKDNTIERFLVSTNEWHFSRILEEGDSSIDVGRIKKGSFDVPEEIRQKLRYTLVEEVEEVLGEEDGEGNEVLEEEDGEGREVVNEGDSSKCWASVG
ncbi:MAG: uncharacterized protein A8A55_2111 [Amphiamblys sp. WSBS2006]|nr:MAG: uncharacterized protein A8A55_2111 [Amphiamblys sp. WSBS2006]